MANVQLFDDFPRVDTAPRRYSEDVYSFYNRAHGVIWDRIRNTLDDWFASYPRPHAADLRGRFRSKHEGAHLGAFWELYVHRMFTRMGYVVEVHPAISGASTRPDFLISRANERLYVEAAVVFSGIVDDDADPVREGWIMDAVNKATHPNFHVGLEFVRRGLHPPRDRDVVRPLLEWLDSLDPDEVIAAEGDPPVRDIDAGEWRLRFWAAPVIPEARGKTPPGRLLGYGPPSVGFVDDKAQLRDTLRRKRGRYGPIEIPLVVAVNCTSTFMKPEDIAGALYGSVAYQYEMNVPGTGKTVRARDGTWMSETGPVGQRMAAMLSLVGLHPGTMATATPWLWHNPWAHCPLAVEWPFSTSTASESGEVTWHERDIDIAGLLGLRADWPGTEPRFPSEA